ncbi:MAG: ferrochelatase [Rickettsiaceae bacterium]|nr:ferrochelatase [Rickettsiaceae bacterium]
MLETIKNDKKVIVLFNLGGPDKLDNVGPFLYNLFSDKWIIRAPFLIRKTIAFFISFFRKKLAKQNYSLIGGKSGLLEETEKQKNALLRKLKKEIKNVEILVSMRYWHPFAKEVVSKIKDYNPAEVIMLPLYPQLSTATTISSFEEFEELLKQEKTNLKVKKIGCYFDNELFIKAHVSLIKKELKKFTKNPIILFSAHSIPKKYVKTGDPYEWQINKTYKAIISDQEISGYETKLCYQSKVGPIEWLSPSTERVIEEEARSGKNILIVPIAFVSEHIETLVELDIEYKSIADKYKIEYRRVQALGDNEDYIDALSKFVLNTIKSEQEIVSFNSGKCPAEFKYCLCRNKNV